jgi:hypothetical protein
MEDILPKRTRKNLTDETVIYEGTQYPLYSRYINGSKCFYIYINGIKKCIKKELETEEQRTAKIEQRKIKKRLYNLNRRVNKYNNEINILLSQKNL